MHVCITFGVDIRAADRNRTGTKFNPRRILSPVRLPVPPLRHKIKKTTQTRLELVTSAVTGRRSNQLSHWAKMGKIKMDLRGLEPRTDRL